MKLVNVDAAPKYQIRGLDFNNKNLLTHGKSGLQFFNGTGGDGGVGDAGAADTGGKADEVILTPPDGKDDKQTDDTKGGEQDSKTFTQEDVNNIAAKEAKKATEKLLKKLGVSDVQSAKDGLTKLQEHLDSQKTDQDKAIERAQALEAQNNDLATKTKTLEAELAAMKADVDPESVSDVVILANNIVSDDVTLEEAITKVLTKYPQFKRNNAVIQEVDKDSKQKPSFTKGEHNNKNKDTEADKWAQAFSFGTVNK